MKLFLSFLSICLVVFTGISYAQCPGGYTQATLNWDNLDYYYNTGGAPYGGYVSSTMEQTHNFGIGTTFVTFATSVSGIVNGKNTLNTCNIPSYTGNDAQFTPSANGQTITLTFATDVQNVMFTLYDVDASQRINIDAYNAANVAQNVGVTLQGTTLLTTTNNNSINTFITASATAIANNDNRGTATVKTANNVLIRKIRLTIANTGSDGKFWFSKMYACVPGTFPINDQQKAACKPFTGQPDYILVTPDNQSVYKVDPATGNAWFLFSDAEQPYVNSLAYDQVNHWLYYVTDGSGSPSINKQLKKYDFSTGTSSVVLADITASPLNIPTFDQGVESAAADFYNGSLYLGIEGGQYSSSSTRYSNVYKIDFDAAGNPIDAVQVYATPAYSGSNSVHDWGDFIVKDGKIIDFNTARSGSSPFYTNSSYVHYDLMSGTVTNTYMNPTPSQTYSGQAAKQWYGNIYDYWYDYGISSGGLKLYNMAGGIGPNINITAITGGWPGGAGDGAGPYRPPMDFGDAPASYDPPSGDPAVHEVDGNLYLGASLDSEWVTRGQTALANSDNYDDALAYVSTFNPAAGNYLTQATVYNNTGANATLCAWLDYNGNGVFDPSEGISVTVPSSSSSQSFYLYWPTISSTLPNGTYTYLRIRITYASNNMTTSNPTGYYNSGEVEDYRVPVNAYALAVQQYNFEAQLTDVKTVQLKWNLNDVSNANYIIERSADGNNWKNINITKPNTHSVTYETSDNQPLNGISYYRLKIIEQDGKVSISPTKKIENTTSDLSVSISPNPAANRSFAYINTGSPDNASLEVINALGMIVHTQNLHLNSGTNSIELPISKLANGRYLVQIKTATNICFQSMLVNK